LLLDLSNRSDIVVDPFLGSGSTLIAAEKAGRVCRGVELDLLYVGVIVRRYQTATGNRAVLVETGETFESMALRRARKALPCLGPDPEPAPAVLSARGCACSAMARGSSLLNSAKK
jgi:DNA methylase